MAVTRIKNNQITDASVTGSKLAEKTITSGLLADNLTYASNLTISGNLTVSGTTVTVDTTNTLVADPLLVLSRGETGTPSVDAGFVIERGTSANVAFIWDESSDVFALVNTNEDGTTTGDVTINSYANLRAGDVESSSASIGNIDINGNTISSTDVNGNITITPSGTGDIALNADTITVGDNNVNVTVTTNGTGDLILNTNSGTNSGSITILDGVNGNIALTPNGTGEVVISTLTVSDLTSGRVLLAGSVGAVEDSANLTFDGTTFSINGDITVGNISINGDTISSVHSTITLDPSTSGAGGTVVIAGNLQVTGSTTTVESTVVTVADPVFQIGSNSVDDNLDRGIKALYNNAGNKVAFFGMDDTNQEFVYIDDAIDTSSVFSGSLGPAAFGSLRVTDLTNNRVLVAGASGEIEDSANLTFDGTNLTTTSVTVSDLTSGRVVLAGTSGAIEDSANLTFNGTTLSVVGNATISNITIDGNSISSSNALTLDAASLQSIVVNEAGNDIDFRVESSGQASAFFIEGTTGNIGLKTATPNSGAVLTMNSTDSFIIPAGTTAQRPPTPVEAMTRFNATIGQLEFYDGVQWKIAGPSFTIITADSFVGDGSTVSFSLSEDATSAGVLVAVDGILQDPGTEYSVSGATLTFTVAPGLGNNIDVRIITTSTSVVSITDLNTSITVSDASETATTTINGNVVLTVTNAAVVPGANVTYDLGSSSLQWNNIYGTATGNTKYTASSLAPTSPNNGDEWWDTDDGSFYKYINDGTTSQWVEWGPNNSLNGNELITGNLIPDTDATYNIGSAVASLSNVYATTFTGTATTAKYADLAENFLADQEYSIGTVLMLGGSAEVTAATFESTAIVGTVSENPAYLMNSDLRGENVVPVAYIGRVPCRVIGVVNRGDLLVASERPGVAKSGNDYLPGQIIGKAIGTHNSDNEGVIEILVGRL